MKISNTTAPTEQKHQLYETASSAVSSQVRAMFGKKFALRGVKGNIIYAGYFGYLLSFDKLIPYQKFPVHGRQLFSFMYGRCNILCDLHLIVILLIIK